MNLNITANKNFSIFLSKFQFLQLLNFFLNSTLTPESYLQHAQNLSYSFHFLTSYSPSTQLLAFRLIWGFWKLSQMIPHAPKHWFCHKNHVSSMLRRCVNPQIDPFSSFTTLHNCLDLVVSVSEDQLKRSCFTPPFILPI